MAVAVVEPQELPDPAMAEGLMMDCAVMDQGGRIRYLRCLVSPRSGLAYTFVRTLRECIYGVVRYAVTLTQRDGVYHYHFDQQVAIKCMNKAVIDEQRGQISEDPLREIAALQLISQPGHLHVQRITECLQDQEYVYAISPFYSGGELFTLVETRGQPFAEDQARAFFMQIISGVEYLHSLRISHRDLSLENILLSGEEDAVIIDMGMCLRYPEGILPGSNVHFAASGQFGKLTYMAQEVFAGQTYDGYAVDVWACGIILFILLTGVPPVEHASALDPRYRMIASGRLHDLLNVWGMDHVTPLARDLLFRLLQVMPEARPTVQQIKTHPWIVGEQR